MASSGMDEVLQFYKTKQLRILAAITPTRNPFFPDVPTVAEAGYPIENPIFDWRGLGVAKGTPPEILKVASRRVPQGCGGSGVHQADG